MRSLELDSEGGTHHLLRFASKPVREDSAFVVCLLRRDGWIDECDFECLRCLFLSLSFFTLVSSVFSSGCCSCCFSCVLLWCDVFPFFFSCVSFWSIWVFELMFFFFFFHFFAFFCVLSCMIKWTVWKLNVNCSFGDSEVWSALRVARLRKPRCELRYVSKHCCLHCSGRITCQWSKDWQFNRLFFTGSWPSHSCP